MTDSRRDCRRTPLVVTLVVTLIVLTASLHAVTFTVTRMDDQLDSSPGDGLCVALNGGGCSLRAAVQEANALLGADGIYLSPGSYSLSLSGADEDLAASGDLDVTSAITLLGTGWANTTISMTASVDRIFDVHGTASLELGDLTLTGGSGAGIGGGVLVRAGGAFAIRRSRIRECSAHHGGGIGTEGGTVTVEDSEIAHNDAIADPPAWFARGPAISADEQATLVVRRSSLHDNRFSSSDSAGGIEVWNSSLTVESTSIVDDGAPTTSLTGTNSELVIVSSTLGRISVDGISLPGASLALGCSIVGYCDLVGGNVTYSNNGLNVFFDGSQCAGPSDTDGEWNLYRLWAPPGKFLARVPNAFSSALEGGHPFVCAPADQWSQTQRPFDNDGDGIPALEIGAVEGATLIFLDGFEIGTSDFWSSSQP